ncbi:hypothetical protein D5073_09650 [Pectobacterium versatile]|nr:Hypothetical protein SCC1_3504 [Pectobacterium versatile]RJL55634.1 hypothetical protein D5073_09650 [Pectobacterium versatile]RJL60393.1 hypothetical protein D5080_16320 [Pectobacterium versatile]RJL62420.1 hypothetical protein D5076_03215 [Pectobacterium versatile]TAI80545.1 hypothetical protein EG333_21190 [Pectobacterium versatile]
MASTLFLVSILCLASIGFQEDQQVITPLIKNTFFDKTYIFIINDLVFSLVRQIRAYFLIIIKIQSMPIRLCCLS